jgi:hypothetical protein
VAVSDRLARAATAAALYYRGYASTMRELKR